MSRIIVKNLPKQIKENRLRKLFASKGGEITDVQLKYTKDGVFRQFAFIGFKEEKDANEASNYFNNTFVDTSRIKVEVSAELGDDEKKPRAWSKYSKDSSFQNKKKTKTTENDTDNNKNKENEKTDSLFNNLKDDADFKEFLEVHRKVDEKQIWNNDEAAQENEVEDDEGDGESGEEEEGTEENAEEGEDAPDTKKNVSDLDYLKTKTVKDKKNKAGDAKDKKLKIDPDEAFTVKLRNLPYKCKKKEIKEFFNPHKPQSLRLPRKVKGIAYALFKTEKGFKAALKKHRSIIGGHRIDVIKYVNKEQPQNAEISSESDKKPWEEKNASKLDNEELESVAESGRLFVRNLAYTCTEDDLETLFKKYGPLSEVNLPIDKFTRKVKGFGFVTFMIPEHAVKACAELDGTSFQGRLMHLLPSKIKKTNEEAEGGSSFKKQQNAKAKASSSSSHNWNSLFLGANAVTDVMSDKYNTSKSQILDTTSDGSMAVRLALGETQIVNETREFLVKHGVNLDEFSQPASERSKVVIIAKNLPSGTASTELKTLFSKFGIVKNVLLPPAGITALIEMEEPSEARVAFRKLAYSKFHHLPLYLEWAPVKVFKENRTVVEDKIDDVQNKLEEAAEEEDEDPDPDASIFVKNLNFSTTEETLREHFVKIGKLHDVTIMKKKKLKESENNNTNLSMGYGFVHYLRKQDAVTAIKELQHSKVDDHAVELKLSTRATQSVEVKALRKKSNVTKQKSSKILVRNVPFEAKKKEIEQLFTVFGELRAVRLPKKVTGNHRGFAFIDFISANDAKRAFNSLCHSTHLYGRRLVLEWAEPESSQDVESIRANTAEHFLQGGNSKRRQMAAGIVDTDELMKSAKKRRAGDQSDGEEDDDM